MLPPRKWRPHKRKFFVLNRRRTKTSNPHNRCISQADARVVKTKLDPY